MAAHFYNALDFKQDLYDRIPSDGEVCSLFCNTSFGDMTHSVWQYDASSAAIDNFDGGFVRPTLQSGNGRWLRRFIIATVGITGNYNDLVGKPTIPTNTNQLTNGAGFITGINSGNVTTALGYAPVNPNGTSAQYIAGDGSKITFPTIPSVIRTTSTLSLSLVGTGATGTQISATKDSTVMCTVSTSTTSTIGGPATSVVALKINSTNSATEGTWTTVATFESDQNITLAIALQSVQVVKGQICADLPAGWYVKLVNSGTGTHAEAFVSAQQTIYG